MPPPSSPSPLGSPGRLSFLISILAFLIVGCLGMGLSTVTMPHECLFIASLTRARVPRVGLGKGSSACPKVSPFGPMGENSALKLESFREGVGRALHSNDLKQRKDPAPRKSCRISSGTWR